MAAGRSPQERPSCAARQSVTPKLESESDKGAPLFLLKKSAIGIASYDSQSD